MTAAADQQQRLERSAGLLLLAAATLALIAANGPLAGLYHEMLHARLGPSLPRVGRIAVHQWVADGLMAIFFLLVGLEVKREWYQGRLAESEERRLPMLAAIAGMAVPALVYLAIIGDAPSLAVGWAIPAATDIAFAIAVLAILGPRVPASIKLLLVAIAIIDDIGAILIIALFYTSDLSIAPLAGAVALTGTMGLLGRLGMRRLWPFVAAFPILWLLTLASGVHATIAGVLAALTIPVGSAEGRSPLKVLEHRIHPWVMLGVVPLFGFVSAGVDLRASAGPQSGHLPVAIAAGLFLGKQLGIFGSIWIAVRTGFASRPAGASWRQLYGAAILCGIGFTMSLFIGALAFAGDDSKIEAAKIGTLAGSLLSALAGYALLRGSGTRPDSNADREEAAELFAADRQHESAPMPGSGPATA